MKTSLSPSGKTLLPTTTCPSCFQAGDVRAAEQPLLTVMHTLFLREHNRVANNLAGFQLGEEWTYQQARRMVIAKWQHIIYNEYLPVLLGPNLAAQANMSAITQSDPAIFTEFSTAAYRMGHSQLKSFIRYVSD